MSRSAIPIRPRHLILSALLSIALMVWAAAPLCAQDAEHPMEAKGIQPTRGSFSLLPWESIDTYSGSVVLTFTDLVLQGNSGLDLRVTRAFNSKGASWKIGIGPSMILFADVPPPYGPASPPKVRTADGGLQTMFETAQNSGVYVTTSLWRYTKATATLETPEGVIYHFLGDGRLSQIADVFGNTIDVTYETGLTRVVQHLGNGQDREVVLAEDAQGRVHTVTYSGRTWTYEYGTGSNLTVLPPVGPSWTFVKENTGTETWTFTVTTPNGAWVAYDFAAYDRFARKHGGLAHTMKVHYRRSGGAQITAGTWEVTYDGMESFGAVVQGPGRRIHYVHDQIGETSVFLRSATVFAESDTGETTPLETTTYAYRSWDNPNVTNVSPVGIEWPPYDPELDVVRADRYPLLITQVQTTRGASVWTKVFAYCGEPGRSACPADPVNDAGLPQQITETGTDASTRTLSFSYRHGFSAGYIRGRVASMTVSQGTETYTSTYGYDDRGFLTSRSAWGIVTTFVPNAFGNVASATDALGHQTSTTYAWGVPQQTTTPVYVIARSINSDGTVASETRQGQTESYVYDAVGRVTTMQPRVGAAVVTTYDTVDGNGFTQVKVTRDGTISTQILDGYGRVTKTVTPMGVTTDVVYDALGRRVAASAPYQAPAYPRRDTTTAYDALDRVTRVDRPDFSWVTSAYTGLDVVITESVKSGESPHVSTQHWGASGTPAQAHLLGVQDAAGVWTTYAYDALGALAAVCGPATTGPGPCAVGSARRTWSYNARHQLGSETHPESGTTAYTYYDDGTLERTTDQAGIQRTSRYDGNHRLTSVESPNRPTMTFTYDDWDNRLSATNGSVQSTLTYEAGTRLTSRTDSIDSHQFVTTYAEYDNRDNLREIRYPVGHAVRYDYDLDNRIERVYNAATQANYASGVAYHPAAGVTAFTAGNGLTHVAQYDERSRPQRITAGALDLTYNYDHLGNVRTLNDGRPNMNQTFTYDPLDRLTSVTGNGVYPSQTFDYDARGNRTSDGVFDADKQWLTSTTAGGVTTTYGYDLNGSLRTETGGRTATYVYNPQRMPESITVGSVTTTYRYDADDLRVTATDNQSPATTRYFIHGLGSQLLSEFAEQAGVLSWAVDYVYLGPRLLAAVRPAAPAPIWARLTVTKAGWGTGTITSNPAGLNCGATCARDVSFNSQVALTATPAAGSVFVGWSGDCGGTVATTTVTLSAARNCTATFQPTIGAPRMWVDIPTAGAQHQPVRISGWAIDVAAPTGSGVSTVHVWAYPNPGSGTPAIFLGVAAYGGYRSDIAAAFGDPRFGFSGFDLTTTGLAPNTYQIVVFAYSTFYGGFNQAQAVTIEIRTPNPAQSMDIPAAGAQVGAAFVVAGWAIDRNTPSGVGVDWVDVSAQLNGAGTPIALGRAMTGPARPDIAGIFGSQFLNCSWGLIASGLSSGNYLITASPHNRSIDGYTTPSTVWVTVSGGLAASAGPRGGPGVGPPAGGVRPLRPASAAWHWWLMGSVVGLVGLLLSGLRVVLGHGRIAGGCMRTLPTKTRGLLSATPHRRTGNREKLWDLGSAPRYTVLIVALLLGVVGVRAEQVTDGRAPQVAEVRAQEVAPAPSPALRAVQELLALSYPELRVSGLAARASTTPEGVVLEFADRGPAVADLVARTAPRPAQLTVMVTLDAEGRVRHLVCHGPWTGLGRAREGLGSGRGNAEARLQAAPARFGSGQPDEVTAEARRLVRLHGLTGARLDAAALEETGDQALWVVRGATEAGESVAVHLEPLTGKLIAFHVGGER